MRIEPPQTPENHEQNDICGEFEAVKGGASSLIEKMLAPRAEKGCIAEFGFRGLVSWLCAQHNGDNSLVPTPHEISSFFP